MSNKKYVSLSKLQTFLENLKETFSALSHKHTISDLTDYTVDSALSSTSTSPVQNAVINEEFEAIATAMNALDAAIDDKADTDHLHDSRYYTESEIDSKLATINTSITNITNGDIVVKEAEHAANADTATNADEATHASTADSATTATTAATATKATKDASGNVITDTYETKSDASAKLTEAKNYADSAATAVKNDLLNGAGEAYDTLKELADLITENEDAIDALETVAAGKADAEHDHTISDITDLTEATETSAGLMSAEDKIQLDNGGIPIITASSEDGVAYTATVDGLGAITAGVTVTIVPSLTATSTTPTLNINGLGAAGIRRKLSSGTLTRPALQYANVIYKDVAVNLMYDGTYWVATQFTKPSATDLYGYVSVQHGGTYVNDETTEDDIAEARDNLSVYSKADHEWVQIYDSGLTTEQINAFANIDISGYKKLMVAVHCINDTTNASSTRYGSAIFKATNGTTYQLPVFNTMFSASATPSGTVAFFDILDGWISCPQSIRSVNYSDFLTDTEGGTCKNMNGMGGALMKCTNTLSTLTITSLDQDTTYFFGVGSRVIVWGCVG